jgi:hypothetical protein
LEKLLTGWITATGVGLVGQEIRDKEAERVERNDGGVGAISLRVMFEKPCPGPSKLKIFYFSIFVFH